MSRSRSRSRDRREEAREIEREEAEEERREQERAERERMEEEMNKRNTLERERMGTSFEPEQRPSKKDQHRRRDEAKEITEEALSRGKSQGQEDLSAPSDTINLSTLADEFKSFGIDGDVSVNGHMEPEPISASLDLEVESAPPSAFRPQPQPRAKPIQPVVSLVQHSAPIETDLDAIQPPYSGYEDSDLLPAAPKTPKTPVLETTFGPEDSDSDDDEDEGPPPPARMG